MTNKQVKLEQKRQYHRMFRRNKGLGKKGSSTPGSIKNPDTCQASKFDKFNTKYARARRTKDYVSWIKSKTFIR